MPIVHLVRHAETTWNTEKRIQGHLDSPLSALGRKQSRWLGERFSGIPLAAAYVSDLGRAQETFHLMFAHTPAPPVHYCRELREIALGRWEGKSIFELAVEDPESFNNFKHHPERYSRPDGESLPGFIQRISTFFDYLLAKHSDEDILILTHGVAMTAITHHLENRNLTDFWKDGSIPSTAVTTIEYHSGCAKILSRMDISHYAEELTPVSWFAEK